MKENMLTQALEKSMNDALDELNMQDIPDYAFSDGFLRKMDALVQSQDAVKKRSNLRPVWFAAMTAVAVICVLAGVNTKNYLNRKNDDQKVVVTDITTTEKATEVSEQLTTTTVTDTAVKTAATETTADFISATSAVSRMTETTSAKKSAETTAVKTNMTSQTTSAAAVTTVYTSVSDAVTTTVSSVPSDDKESDMKKFSIQKYSAFLSAVSIAVGSNGVITTAEKTDNSESEKLSAIIYMNENYDKFDFDEDGKFSIYDGFAHYLYTYSRDELTENYSENVSKNGDINGDGIIDETDNEIFAKYCFFSFLSNKQPDEEEWESSSYTFGTKESAERFLSFMKSIDEDSIDSEDYKMKRYPYLVLKAENGELSLDVNNDGITDMKDLYCLYLFTEEQNAPFLKDTITIPENEKKEIWERCQTIYDETSPLSEENYFSNYFIAKYFILNNDITAEETTAKYYSDIWGTMSNDYECCEESFTKDLILNLQHLVTLRNEFDDYKIKLLGDLIYREYADHIEIVKCSENAKEVVIPSSIVGKPVTAILENSFSDCNELESVIVSNGITKIGDSAFFGCDLLREITLPDSVQEIGESAFAYSSLEIVNIPESEVIIGDNAFDGTPWFKKMKKSNEMVIIGSTLLSIPKETEEFTVPDNVMKIGNCVFNYSNLKTIKFNNRIKEIGNKAFLYCVNLEEIILPDSVEKIGESAFESCSSLKKVRLPEELYSLSDNVFSYCRSLTEIEMPKKISSIGMSAFSDCINLENIYLSDDIVELGSYSFKNCKMLKEIVIPDGITELGPETFSGCTSLEKVTLHDNISYIWSNVFRDCTSLEYVRLPQNIDEISESVFNGSGIKEIEIPESVQYIGIRAFYDCKNLEKVILNEGGICSIERDAFCNTGIKEITIPKSVTRISVFSTFDRDVILNVYEGSYAEQFAISEEYKYKLIGTVNNHNETDVTTVNNHNETDATIFGDANCDGNVNMADAVIIMQSIANPDKYGVNGTDDTHITEQGMINADVNGDGVTNTDALDIQRFTLKYIRFLPVE